MLKSHEKFHSTNGKRLILIADDELINREILREMLQRDYEIIFAENGEETLQQMRRYSDTLSLVLLDILMPVVSGLEVLKTVREDEILSRIPIIVTTAEKETEIESLQLGAIDFIPKPYPPIGVIQARVLRTIELHEDRDIIQLTERDELTGLYNLEYFYRYAEQYDQYHRDTVMDAVVLDVNHFRMLNERYGKAYGDYVLKRMANGLRSIVGESGGIVCRKGSDTFMVYCPHREDYRQLLENAYNAPQSEDDSINRVRLRMGVYASVDKSIDIERRFDRAKMAADTVKGSFKQNIGYYDNNLHERQLYAEQLIEDFPAAIAEGQFRVFYQPKFDVRPDTPILTSAEALVRWVHPTLGMISPGVFIPLFEENGLIQRLDTYVWRETARQIRDWKERLHYAIPVSVNVSRVDVYDEDLADTLQNVLKEQDLSPSDLLLELTESAYTQDSRQIVETVENLRGLSFKIEMDDFGTGYSSLNMISSLPIDALKLDMHFIRDAFKEGGNTHLLEVIIGIADYLSVPVIAEGVETEQQLRALKALGCDIVQGYFFSRPVPAEEFEAFILQKKEADAAEAEKLYAGQDSEPAGPDYEEKVLQAQISSIEGQATAAGALAEEDRESGGIHLRTASVFSVILAVIAAAALLIADISVTRGYQRMQAASDRYVSAQMAASDLESGSDYLTDRVRCFVVTGEVEYLKDFFEEVDEARRRDKAVENMEVLLEGTGSSALDSLNTALNLSNELVTIENLAMRLMVEAGDYSEEDIPKAIASIDLGPAYKSLSPRELKDKAQDLVFNNNYMHYKDKIRENVNLCAQSLLLSASRELEQATSKLALLVNIQTVLSILFLLIVLGIVGIVTHLVRKPLTNMVQKMQRGEEVPVAGVEELRFVTRTYNTIMEENRQAKERLSHEASHDALTGLFNRGAYDLLLESADTEHMALILLDMDGFKGINDTYGHAVGDRALKRVAELMKKSFRSVDILCRIGGDEFAIVMTRVNSSMRQLVLNKINHINDLLQHPSDDLPPLSLSVGVAFSDREHPQGDIFRDADSALYQAKNAGGAGCRIFE